MNFIKRLLVFSFVNIWVLCGTFLLFNNPMASDMQITISFVIYIATIIIFTIVSACYYWGKNINNIFHMPIAQTTLCLLTSVFLYIKDLLGYRHTSGFLDFGVGFDIIVIVMMALTWIVPSFIASITYSIIKNKDKR